MPHISVSIILIIHFSVNSVTHFYLLYHRVDLLIKGLSFLVHIIYVLIVYSQKNLTISMWLFSSGNIILSFSYLLISYCLPYPLLPKSKYLYETSFEIVITEKLHERINAIILVSNVTKVC